MQAAATPNMDELARRGELGCARTIPPGMDPGSDIANLAIMGYDPARYHTGRAPLEAAALGVELGPEEVAFRCNLVTLRHEDGKIFMEDYSAGHISSEEAREIIQVLDSALGQEGRRFYPGVSYRHLLVWAAGEAAWRTYPPHDWTGQEVGQLMTSAAAPLWDLVRASWPVLQGLRSQPPAPGGGQKARHLHLALGPGAAAAAPHPEGALRPYRRGDLGGGPDPGHRQIRRPDTHPGARGHRLPGHQLRR